jgi:hypothetical protein
MRTLFGRGAATAFAIGLTGALAPAFAEEGMWTLDNFPSQSIATRYGAKIDQAWLDRVRLATIRLSNCTASFVSPDGLILTNHHCAEACLAEHSTRDRSLIEAGFLAAKPAEEPRCGTQIADTLVATENITDKVGAATRGLDDRAANDARKKALTELESACEAASSKDKKTGPLKCESVTLYQGGQYFLYKYKRYADVRLVFAPEAGIAAFGGDPDNFQFPRYCLDMSIMRAYENGKPAKTPNYLRINFAGPQSGELVFVSGHPGTTDRLLTVSQLQFQRDVMLPNWLLRYSELRGRYIQFAKTGTQAERITTDVLNSIENSIKVRRKELDALLDDALMERKRNDETALRASVTKDPQLRQATGDPWGDTALAEAVERTIYLPYVFAEGAAGFNSRLFRSARTLVRGAAERGKPNTERLREFTDAALPRIEQDLGAPTPVYPELERLTLVFGLERMREWLGPDHPLIRRLLVTESPDQLAERVISGTKLGDAAVRLALWKGGAAAVDASTDPMIALAKLVDPDARAIRKRYEDEVEAPTDRAAEKLAHARFAALGTSVYPDATFTLRLNYGTVQGWIENGTEVPPFTRLETAFARATGADPFRLPDSWTNAKARLDLATPVNFSTNNDIVGGNSGSPVINAKGEIVGLAFDGNIHSISGSYWFDTAKNRMIAVHPAIMREALAKVYGARELLRQLGGR